MKRRAGSEPSTGSAQDLTDAEVTKLLRYALFDDVCKILGAGRTMPELKLLRHQRAQLEKKLGYHSLPRRRKLEVMQSRGR